MSLRADILNTIDLVEFDHGKSSHFRTDRVCKSIDDVVTAIERMEREHAALLAVYETACLWAPAARAVLVRP